MINKISGASAPQFKGTVQGERQLRAFTEGIDTFLKEAKAFPEDDKFSLKVNREYSTGKGNTTEFYFNYLPGKESQHKGREGITVVTDFDGVIDFINTAGSKLNYFMQQARKGNK